MTERPKKFHFSEEERWFLRSLVTKHAKILENKKSDVIALAEKKKTWNKLTEEFNSVPNHMKRSANQLKKAWENIKFRRKAEIAAERRERLKTGDGSYESSVNNYPELDPLEVYTDGSPVDRDDLRVQRNLQFIEHDQELHHLKKRETELKVISIEEEISQNRILFELKKKKLELQIKKLEEE